MYLHTHYSSVSIRDRKITRSKQVLALYTKVCKNLYIKKCLELQNSSYFGKIFVSNFDLIIIIIIFLF